MGADLQEQSSFGFEGFEKRLEIDFEQVEETGEEEKQKRRHKDGDLRCLSRNELDEMLRAAECSIVSEQHNQYFDAYVLSESSLFVYPQRLILKTCGKTRLLNAVGVLLGQAASLRLRARSCKYSRGTFIFPDAQPFPHTSFDEEVCVLDELFADMVCRGSRSAHVLEGDSDSRSGSWHIYRAVAAGKDASSHENMCLTAIGEHDKFSLSSHRQGAPSKGMLTGKEQNTVALCKAKMERGAGDQCKKACKNQSYQTKYTLEMCMTHLDSSSASHFMNPSGMKTGAEMTRQSGISALLPNALISDFAFVPCGYSMNGLEGDALSTIHITPEEGHSYASFEIMGYDPASFDLQALINRVVACFKPGSLVMSMYASALTCGGGDDKQCELTGVGNSWCSSEVVPNGYVCKSSDRQELVGGGAITFHTFTRTSTFEKEFGVVPKPLCKNANIPDRTTAVVADEISHVQSESEHMVVRSNNPTAEAKPFMKFREHNADGGFQQSHTEIGVSIFS